FFGTNSLENLVDERFKVIASNTPAIGALGFLELVPLFLANDLTNNENHHGRILLRVSLNLSQILHHIKIVHSILINRILSPFKIDESLLHANLLRFRVDSLIRHSLYLSHCPKLLFAPRTIV